MLPSDSERSVSHILMQSGARFISSALLAIVTLAAVMTAFSVNAQDFPGFLDPYGKLKADLKQRGIEYTVNYTSEDAGNLTGGARRRFIHAGQAAVTGQFDMNKLFGWYGATTGIAITHRDGLPINDLTGMHSLLQQQEIWGRGNFFRLTQLWLRQNFFDGQLSITAGRLNVGHEFGSFPCKFMNLSFCGSQSGNIVGDYLFNWPVSQWAAFAKLELGWAAYLKVGAYQERPKNLDSDWSVTLDPRDGTGVLVPFELGWLPVWGGRQESIKIGGWYASAKRADVYLDVDHNSAGLTGSPFLQRRGSYGTYLAIMAQILKGPAGNPAGGLSAFFNTTFADTRTTNINSTTAMGFLSTGLIPARPFDELGLALAINHLNSRTSDYRRDLLSAGKDSRLPGSNELVLALYYGFQLSYVLQFRPEIQWIKNPGGITSRSDAVVAGARTTVTF